MSDARAIEGSDRLYVDTTVFINLGLEGALLPLIQFLGSRARIVDEVDAELKRNSSKDDFKFLGTLDMIRDWPPVEPVELTAEQLVDVFSIQAANRRPGDHPLKDLGEIATVIAAKADGRVPVISDDGLAAKLCSTREMTRLTTPQVLEEMRAAGALATEESSEVRE